MNGSQDERKTCGSEKVLESSSGMVQISITHAAMVDWEVRKKYGWCSAYAESAQKLG